MLLNVVKAANDPVDPRDVEFLGNMEQKTIHFRFYSTAKRQALEDHFDAIPDIIRDHCASSRDESNDRNWELVAVDHKLLEKDEVTFVKLSKLVDV